jgi:sodium transport system permease protein
MLITVFTVLKKEWRDTLRDMRSLRMIVLMPIYLVGVFVASSLFAIHMGKQSRATTHDPIQLSVSGVENLSPLVDWLKERGVAITSIDGDAYKKVEQNELGYALIIPKDAQQKFSTGESIELLLVFDATNTKVQGSLSFVRQQIWAWQGRIGSLRLMSRGIDPSISSPVFIRDINIASDQKMGFFVIATVPFFLLMACFLGSIGFSADMVSGERERRSLESLLITPAQSSLILIGKWLNSYILTLLVILVALGLLAIAFHFLPFKDIGMKVDVVLADIACIFLVLFPVAILATSLQFLISIFARSFKDAQTYMGLMVFIPMVPLFYTLMNPSSYQDWFMWVPVLAHQIMIKNILLGELVTSLQLLQLASVSILLGALLLSFTAKQLRKPKIVYGL